MAFETWISITLIITLIVFSAFKLAYLHLDINNLMAITSHKIDRPSVWRTGKPDRAHRRRNKRK